jgi:hypothetical protein
LNDERKALDNDECQWKEKDDEMKKQERIRPLDVDDLTHEGKSKTSINKKVTEERPKNMTEEEQAEYYVSIDYRRCLCSLYMVVLENIHRQA